MSDLKKIKLFLLDMDGTIYLDNELFDGTLDFLRHVKASGGKYIFLTNNSSKSVDKYIEKLASLGINSVADDFLTSTNATITYLKGKNYKKYTLREHPPSKVSLLRQDFLSPILSAMILTVSVWAMIRNSPSKNSKIPVFFSAEVLTMWQPIPTGSAPLGTAMCPTAAQSVICSFVQQSESLSLLESLSPIWHLWLWKKQAFLLKKPHL